MLTPLWITWLVLSCVSTLVRVLRPKSRLLAPMSFVLGLGVVAFVVWVTNGLIVAFLVLGVVLSLLSLLLLALIPPLGGRRRSREELLALARLFTTPSLVLGVIVGGAIELGGHWSGGEFVVWRAFAGGAIALGSGIAFFARSMRQGHVEALLLERERAG